MKKRVYNEHKAAPSREIRRHESPLLQIESADDWMSEVDQRAGVVGLFFLPVSSSSSTAFEQAKKAVEELRAKEQKKKMRSNVVQFLAIPRRDDVPVSKVEDILAGGGGSGVSQEDKETKTGVYFISSRKKVASRFLGAVSGDGLFGFMRNELKNGIGVKTVDMEELKKAMM